MRLKNIIFITIIVISGVILIGRLGDLKSTFIQAIEGRNGINRLSNCQIKQIKKLPQRFSVVIGHAYGSPALATKDSFIAPRVEKFLSMSHKSIKQAIFTGDVFSVPSSAKWNKLKDKFKNMAIFIAPGNHDVLRARSREAFEKSNTFPTKFPYVIEAEKINIIIEDSISSNWRISKEVVQLINAQDGPVVVARHNIPIQELTALANSSEGGALEETSDIINKFDFSSEVTWIIGDGGAFGRLPRISCKQFNNHRFIVNGIGEQPGDTVLILSNGEIFQYQL